MKVYDCRRAAADALAARPDRPATAIVHDSADVRVVVFRIEPGQEVRAHRSTSTVLLSVLEGSGTFTGAGAEHPVSAGILVAYGANELHGMRAGDETLTILATIAPRPGAREA